LTKKLFNLIAITIILGQKTNKMKTTKTGYRINKNGTINKGVEDNAVISSVYLGSITKRNGVYHYISRKQGKIYIYLP